MPAKPLLLVSIITCVTFLGTTGCNKSRDEHHVQICSPEIEQSVTNLEESLDLLRGRTSGYPHGAPSYDNRSHHGNQRQDRRGRRMSLAQMADQDCTDFFNRMDAAGIQSCNIASSYRGQNVTNTRDNYVDECNKANAQASQSGGNPGHGPGHPRPHNPW